LLLTMTDTSSGSASPTPTQSDHATLQRWLDDEAAARARMAPAGVSRPDQVAGLSGLQVFQAMLDGRLPSPHIGHQMHFVLVHAEHGRAVFQGRPDRSCYNPLGTVHGGWFATLLDSAVGCAVHTTLPPGKGYTTLEIKLNLVRALTDRVPLVRAEGQVVHAGKQVATAEGRLVGHDGKLYAHATTTCLVFDVRQ
jgi:uncharacterized protein (TIGR00369 family)